MLTCHPRQTHQSGMTSAVSLLSLRQISHSLQYIIPDQSKCRAQNGYSVRIECARISISCGA
jgi:hypothetical protein